MSEHREQATLFHWAEIMQSRHPQLALMFAIPNGGKRKSGWWEKAEGLKSGVPDIFLAVPTQEAFPRYGLFIEMKFGKNKPSRNQKGWIDALIAEGYAVEVCYSFEEAKQAIIGYLGLDVG